MEEEEDLQPPPQMEHLPLDLLLEAVARSDDAATTYGRWGAIRLVKLPREDNSWCLVNLSMHSSPAIIGRTVHWICCSTRRAVGVFILAVHADTAEATAIEPPPQCCLGSVGNRTLAATGDGKLSMFVPETGVISMWTLSTEEGWSRDAAISIQGINKQVRSGMDAKGTICWCVGFLERSRTVLIWMERVGLIQLNLGTNKAALLHSGGELDITGDMGACFHEIDLASLL